MMNQHFDRENAIRTDRIAHYEEIMDRIIRVVKLDGITPGVYESVLPELKELEDYYTSPEWQEDYAADEAGLLPDGLKRGVLSQDGILYHLYNIVPEVYTYTPIQGLQY